MRLIEVAISCQSSPAPYRRAVASTPTHRPSDGTPALALTAVTVARDESVLLREITWAVNPGERWLVVGANGSGKTTLLRVAALYVHPTRGEVEVLGERLGRTDVRTLRRRIGYASAALAAQLRLDLTAAEIVMTAKNAALEPWWHRYDDLDRQRARACLDRMGVARYAERRLATLSSGEQQRVLLARTLMNDPGVVLLDEPSARLDLGGRESLVVALGELATDRAAPPLVLVTHHVDEIPPGITHALLLRGGAELAAGPLDSTLTSESLSACFDMPLTLERRHDGRFSAWATR